MGPRGHPGRVALPPHRLGGAHELVALRRSRDWAPAGTLSLAPGEREDREPHGPGAASGQAIASAWEPLIGLRRNLKAIGKEI